MLALLALAVGMLAAAQATLEQSTEWPQFRGPNASGVAGADAAPPIGFGPTKCLLWKQPLSTGHSSPVVWGDRIFLTGFEAASKKLELISLAGNTGAILWRRVASAAQIEETHVVSNAATATPALDRERVYAYFSSYGVMAFTHSGEAQWTLPLPMPKTHHGSGASPVLPGNLLIVNHDAMEGGYLLAVDRRTGKEVWRQEYSVVRGRVESYSTPVVWRDQLILHRSGIIEGYGVASGQRRWTLAANTSGASTAAVASDVIYVNTWNNLGEEDQRTSLPDFAALLKLYDKDGDGAISEAEFPIWRENASIPEVPSPLLYQGRLFLVRNGGVATCLDAETGKVIYRARAGGPGPYFASPVAAGGRVYLASGEGIVTVIAAGKDQLEVLARNNLDEPVVATPAIARKAIYVRTAKHLYAFGE